jgi:drug/metabolite transporter (DMT)-like permease
VRLAVGLLLEPWPQLNLASWGIVVWLAVVNTAVAFTLWNHTLRTLSAMESSIINNTMLIQITVLAWLFLGETLTGIKIVGLVLAAFGALLVQVRMGRRERP